MLCKNMAKNVESLDAKPLREAIHKQKIFESYMPYR